MFHMKHRNTHPTTLSDGLSVGKNRWVGGGTPTPGFLLIFRVGWVEHLFVERVFVERVFG